MIKSELAFVTKAINFIDIYDVVRYNVGIGFDKITIYDNESFADLNNLKKLFRNVDIIPIKGFPNQRKLYTDICKYSNSKWVCLQDDDETLYMRDYNNVNDFLENYDKYSGVSINIKEVSTRKALMESADSGPSWIELATWLNPLESVIRHVTTIVKPLTVQHWPTPHIPIFKRGYSVMPNHRAAIGPNGNIICDEAYFYHYALKDYDYHKIKIARGCADDGRKRPLETWDQYQERIEKTYTVEDNLMKNKYLEVIGK